MAALSVRGYTYGILVILECAVGQGRVTCDVSPSDVSPSVENISIKDDLNSYFLTGNVYIGTDIRKIQ